MSAWNLDYLLHGLRHLNFSLALATSKRSFLHCTFSGESYTAQFSEAINIKSEHTGLECNNFYDIY